jgi:hypothetical protein
MSVYVLDHVEGKRLRQSYDEWPTSPPSGKTLAKPKRAKKKFQPERLQDQKNFLIIIRLKTPAQTAPP